MELQLKVKLSRRTNAMFTLYSTFNPIVLNVLIMKLRCETKQRMQASSGRQSGQASAEVAKHLGMFKSIFPQKHVET